MRATIAPHLITLLTVLLVTPPSVAEDLKSCGKGLSAAKKGKFDDAIKFYDQCVSKGKLKPRTEARWRYKRASTYLAKRRVKEAIRDFSEAIRLNPKYSLAYGSRGLSYEADGQKALATSDYKKARSLGLKAK